MRFLLAMAMLLAPASAAAQLRDGLCHDMRMVIASAAQREPFERVTFHETWDRFRLFVMCRPNRVGPVDRVVCHWRLPSREDIRPALAAEGARCLPRARREDVPNAAPSGSKIRFRLGELSIYLNHPPDGSDQRSEFADLFVVIRESDEEFAPE